MNWCDDYAIGELMMKVVADVEYLWKFSEILNFYKMVFDSWVLSILEYLFMYMTYKHYLGRVLSVEGLKLECLGKKGFEIRSFFSGLKSVRLSVR